MRASRSLRRPRCAHPGPARTEPRTRSAHASPRSTGRVTLDEVERRLGRLGSELGCEVDTLQSASTRAVLIDAIQGAAAAATASCSIPGAHAHERRAARCVRAPACRRSRCTCRIRTARGVPAPVATTAAAAVGVSGFGPLSYELALRRPGPPPQGARFGRLEPRGPPMIKTLPPDAGAQVSPVPPMSGGG